MKKNWLLFGGVALLVLVAVLMVNSARTIQPESHGANHSAGPSPTAPSNGSASDCRPGYTGSL